MTQFYLSLYKPTELELFIEKKYRENGIESPNDLELNEIAQIFNCHIAYKQGRPMIAYDEEDGGLIFLKANDNDMKQRLDFFHELCHVARHFGDQREMHTLFIDLQEQQASSFQLYAAMPSYMIGSIEPERTWHEYILKLSFAFGVPTSFAAKRIDQIKRRIYQEHQDRNYRALTSPSKARYGFTNETLRVLDQLQSQTNYKGADSL